ncbi:MAG: phytanoyl-CoA dioxygenase family protein [Chloroflexi bacterium]|nr:phytanoyl-CoA dioxygenase family protein [Chloroflexota bacterium]
MGWEPTEEQKRNYEERGYFTVPNVVSRQTAAEMLGVIKNAILTPDTDDIMTDADPMDPMNDDTPQARSVRFRKLSKFNQRNPLIWHNAHCGKPVLEIARYFLGDDILLKYDSCFLKPARSGSATPWHQDNGLWRDGDIEPFNFWMALDPATIENGCLQMIPGSYRTEIVPHVLYEDSIHGVLPKERVEEMIDTYGVEHIELGPGSIVVWHSSAWHYSPPNTSEKGRIAIAGVFSSPDIVENGRSGDVGYKWLMKDGAVMTDFPAQEYAMKRQTFYQAEPWKKVS